MQSQRLTTRQSLAQKQVMTQKLIQSIRLMAMPLQELRETIRDEADKNPALEIVREAAEVPLPSRDNPEPEAFANSSDPGYLPGPKGDPDGRQRFLEGAVFREESLGDHLTAQLHLTKIPENIQNTAEKIIWNLDGDGFHQEDPDFLSAETTPEELDWALRTVRALDPQGCACSGWKESLIVQAGIRGDAPPHFARFVTEALPMMEKKRPSDVRASMNMSEDDWEDLEEYIKCLQPFPGRLYSADAPQYIAPDIVVRKEEGEYQLILNDEVMPVLRVDPEFENIEDSNKDTKKFIASHAREARYFINSLAQRDNTLLKTARSIVEFQRDFFTGGPGCLKPLTLKNIAEDIGVHETTVSRITTNKYIQTEWGLFELKYFFSSSVSGPDGSGVSKVAVQEVIKNILTEAPPGKRLSDQKITDLLSGKGISVARRTVAKYRKELDLPSSYQQ